MKMNLTAGVKPMAVISNGRPVQSWYILNNVVVSLYIKCLTPCSIESSMTQIALNIGELLNV